MKAHFEKETSRMDGDWTAGAVTAQQCDGHQGNLGVRQKSSSATSVGTSAGVEALVALPVLVLLRSAWGEESRGHIWMKQLLWVQMTLLWSHTHTHSRSLLGKENNAKWP